MDVGIFVSTSCSYVSTFRGLQKEETVLLTHGDSVDKVADGFKVVAQSGNVIAGMYFPCYFFWFVLLEAVG